MRRTTALLATIACCVLCTGLYADYVVNEAGAWPKSWPAELEPLRKRSRTLTGSQVNLTFHEIPFAKHDEFESAWPHILKVKTRGAPVVLVRGPDARLGTIKAGVRIQCPPPGTGDRAVPAGPLPGAADDRGRWLWTTFVELVVDGDVVDLNRIPLPADTPIIDRRFEDGDQKR